MDLIKTILTAGGALYLALLLGALFLSDWMLFPISPRAYEIPGLVRLPIRGWGEIAALHLRNPEARLTLLHSHGNGEDLGSLLPLLEEYRRRGYSVLAYDYPGYGRSSGKASENGTYAAIDRCYRYLTSQQGVSPTSIVLYGRSLGAGPSVDLAARKSVGGLILEGGFVSAFRVLTRVQLLPWDKFESERKMSQINCPVFVMQAAHDEVVGYWHGPRLHAAANEPRVFWRVEGAGHNDLIASSGEEYWRRLQAFADSLPASASSGAANSVRH